MKCTHCGKKNHSQHLLGSDTQRKNTYKGMFQNGNNSLHSDVSEPGGFNVGSSSFLSIC